MNRARAMMGSLRLAASLLSTRLLATRQLWTQSSISNIPIDLHMHSRFQPHFDFQRGAWMFLNDISKRSSSLAVFQGQAVSPLFSSRCMTTVANTVDMSSQGSPLSTLDIAPRIKFKRLDKTARHIMQILDKEAVEEVKSDREIPDIKPGYTVQLKVVVPENKRRVSIVKGTVIARRNAGINTTFRIRRLVAGVGIESLFLLYSPNIKEIKILEKKKVRRAKLYYLRDRMNALKKR